jgi:hypothetical protein
MFEYRAARKVLGPKAEKEMKDWKIFIMRSFMTCAAHNTLFG